MASKSVTKLTYLLKKGDVAAAVASVAAKERVPVWAVTFGMQKVVITGTVVHVAKSKMVTYTRTLGDKRQKKEGTYFRLVFCR